MGLTEVVADGERPVGRPGGVQVGARRDAPHRFPDDVVGGEGGWRGGDQEEEAGQERGQGRAEHPHRRWLPQLVAGTKEMGNASDETGDSCQLLHQARTCARLGD